MSNTLGQTAGFLAPVTAGLLLKDQNDHSSWLLAFWVSALAHIPGLIAFQCFSTDQIQDWAKEEDSKEDPELANDKDETNLDADDKKEDDDGKDKEEA